MSLIKRINSEHIVDYSKNHLDYFCSSGSTSTLSGYQRITDAIRVAKKSVKIATTNELSDDIYDSLHQNGDLNVYIMFKSFETATGSLSKFNNKQPIIAREVQELDNNFIIVDDVSFLMVNPLCQKENLFLEFNEIKTQDLNFIFNYLFWNCATLEKLIDEVSLPVESPFPPFGNREMGTINLSEENIKNVEAIFIPRDKKFSYVLDDELATRYFSEDIKTPIYLTYEYTQIGSMRIKNMRFIVGNFWELKRNILSDISTNSDIIPREDSWFEPIKVAKSSVVVLKNITAQMIVEMKETRPEQFPGESYINTICFKWEVLPPIKPTSAKRSSLYSEYSKLAHDLKQQLSLLENRLSDLKQESNLSPLFLGVNKKASKDLVKIAKYKEIIIEVEKPNELREFLTKEFEEFFKEVMNSEKSFKNNKSQKEAEQQWEKMKKAKNSELNKKQEEVETIKNNLKIDSDDKAKQKDSLKSLEKNLGKLNQNIKDNYTKFVYEPKKNELLHLSNEKTLVCKEFVIPRFALPEEGTLYETNDSYYLEIYDYEQLDQAKELEKRYNDKKYKVVVGVGDE